MLENQVMKAVRAELPFYPDVKMEPVDRGGKHRRILFRRGGESRFLTVPRSPSDHRASRNAIRDFRRTMRELGAERTGDAPHLPKRTGKRAKLASFGLTENQLVFHVPKESKVLRHFRRPDGKAAAHWEIYFRPSPDLTAPPLLALKRTTIPAGMTKKYGVSSGFEPGPGAWRITLSRGNFPNLTAIDHLSSVPLTLYEETSEELVFKLPPGTLPTGFRPKPLDPDKLESLTTLEESGLVDPKPEPQPEPVASPAAPSAVELGDRPLVLQMPKQSISVEMAVAILNKAKRRLGSNLRFTIEEGGYLSAVHRIGH